MTQFQKIWEHRVPIIILSLLALIGALAYFWNPQQPSEDAYEYSSDTQYESPTTEESSSSYTSSSTSFDLTLETDDGRIIQKSSVEGASIETKENGAFVCTIQISEKDANRLCRQLSYIVQRILRNSPQSDKKYVQELLVQNTGNVSLALQSSKVACSLYVDPSDNHIFFRGRNASVAFCVKVHENTYNENTSIVSIEVENLSYRSDYGEDEEKDPVDRLYEFQMTKWSEDGTDAFNCTSHIERTMFYNLENVYEMQEASFQEGVLSIFEYAKIVLVYPVYSYWD